MDKVCSGEIAGYKFSVPCFPEKYLINSYGAWKDPQSIFFRYANVLYEPEEWSELEWFDAFRAYFNSGELHTKYTYDYLIDKSKLPKKPSYEAFLRYLSNNNKSELIS